MVLKREAMRGYAVSDLSHFWERYKRRLRRKRLLWRAFRKRRDIASICRKTGSIRADDILLFATVRNEVLRLPYFLQHYRRLGVDHFLIVDNGSDDGTVSLLKDAPDVSLWRSDASYKNARFGMDWLTCLLWRYGQDHWTITVDADELLIYPDWENRNLKALTGWMDAQGQRTLGAMMLDLYPKGPVDAQNYLPGQDPMEVLNWFDGFGYWVQRQKKLENLWMQGGPRARLFFSKAPNRAPTLNKIPLVRWKRSYVYVNSTHNALPTFLNRTYDEHGIEKTTGVLLHTKFLPDVAARARSEKTRRQHFADPNLYHDYYDALAEGPDFWCAESLPYEGWEQLCRLRVMSGGGWWSN